jgi:hypothetical protein
VIEDVVFVTRLADWLEAAGAEKKSSMRELTEDSPAGRSMLVVSFITCVGALPSMETYQNSKALPFVVLGAVKFTMPTWYGYVSPPPAPA